MKKSFIFLTLLCASLFGYSQQEVVTDVIEKELREEMSIRKSDELISVNIILKAQYDQMEMRSKSDAYSTKEAKREFVVNELKSFTENTQAPILEVIKGMSKNYEVKDLKTHWLANMITCDVPTAVIEELATRKDILIIGFNKEQYLLFDEKATPVEQVKTLTQNITQVNADQVWDLGYTGEGIIVAVVDTGVNYNHLDVADHLWDGGEEFPHHGWDCYNNDNNPMDDMGHGSHCAGTVLGDGTAGTLTGMAPDATLMCVKVLNAGGNGSLEQIVGGIEFSVEHGAHIFSMSLGFHGGGTESERIAFRVACVNSLEAGVVGAIAAGNEYGTNPAIPNNVRVPGNCPPPWLHPDQTTTGGTSCCVCIGAVDYNDNAADFTSRGPVTWQHIPGYEDYPYNPGMGLIRPDVCAPGVDIISLNYYSNTGYTTMSGTSMATPCVAGVMALMMSKNEDLTPAKICEILETTGIPLSETKSNTFGSGRIDALAAVETVTAGPIRYHSVTVNDELGNNDGFMNPGETISITLNVRNEGSQVMNDVNFLLTSKSPYITFIDSVFNIESMQPNTITTLENAFSFVVSEDAEPTKNITFSFEANSTGFELSKSSFKIETFGNIIGFSTIAIDDSELGNANGMLEPGETADLYVYIENAGNVDAHGMFGNISTTDEFLTFNNNDRFFGSIFKESTRYASFNVTLDENAPTVLDIPVNLVLTDNLENQYDINFSISSECNVVFNLNDSYGDGWNGAAIIVSFDDGTPEQTLTITSGNSETYTLPIMSGTTVSLTWQPGSWDSECSYSVAYEGGETIYSGQGGQQGTFYTWVNSCAGGSQAQYCDKPQNFQTAAVANTVVLTWEGEISGRDSYRIYRDGEILVNYITESTYTDIDLENGEYCYAVEAVYKDVCTSEPTDIACQEVSFTPTVGDVNGDSSVNISDINAVIAYILDQNPYPFFIEPADVNNDGIINVLDIFIIVNIIMQ